MIPGANKRISLAGKHGAGLYGAVHGRTTTCQHANNPYGHNPDCNCGWTRASQTVPYMEGDHEPSD